MPYYVDGEDISPEEVTQDQGWRSAGVRRVGAKTRTADSNAPSLQPGARRGKSGGAALKSKVLRAGRMPSLPRNDIKIVIRPRVGLDISKIGAVTVADAILAAAGISQEDLCQDTLCPNLQQNIMVASTPKRENASRYVRMRQILISGKVHELSAYETTPHSTSRGRACSRGRSGSRPRSSSKPGHDTSGRIRSRSRTPTSLRSKKPSLSWADMARGGREAPRGDDLRRDSHHANELEKLRRDNEQLRKENARVKQEMSRLAAEMAEIRKLALSPSPAQPASVPVPVAMDTSEASHGSSAPKRRAVENRQEDETIKLLSELNNAVASMQASLEKVQAAIAHPKMGLGALSERISKLEEVDARPAPSQVAVQRNVLAPPTEGAILRAALSAQPSPQPKHG
ncbi:hypothetical protein HPB49_018223 [Dermacentor silvarum]|uniref:Uncharacterized protein n=1 Tax=Dermacentor silvarum TaxID=543639 RepID=A0ACB8CAN8_DERSI|nr:hypothetical protein HPB49_018223 [Dermacentor silvarum]